AAVGVPGDDRLTLVGDPDRLELAALDSGVRDRRGGHPPRRLPDLGRVVLDPAGAGKVLLELRVGPTRDPRLSVEDEAGRPSRALVDREDHRGGGYPASAWAPRTIVSSASPRPETSSSPVPSRRTASPYISATIERAWRSASGTWSASRAATATSS